MGEQTIEDLQRQLDEDPELKEYLQNLLLRYNLLLMGACLPKGQVTGEERLAVMRTLARKESQGDKEMEAGVMGLLLGYEQGKLNGIDTDSK